MEILESLKTFQLTTCDNKEDAVRAFWIHFNFVSFKDPRYGLDIELWSETIRKDLYSASRRHVSNINSVVVLVTERFRIFGKTLTTFALCQKCLQFASDYGLMDIRPWVLQSSSSSLFSTVGYWSLVHECRMIFARMYSRPASDLPRRKTRKSIFLAPKCEVYLSQTRVGTIVKGALTVRSFCFIYQER